MAFYTQHYVLLVFTILNTLLQFNHFFSTVLHYFVCLCLNLLKHFPPFDHHVIILGHQTPFCILAKCRNFISYFSELLKQWKIPYTVIYFIHASGFISRIQLINTKCKCNTIHVAIFYTSQLCTTNKAHIKRLN